MSAEIPRALLQFCKALPKVELHAHLHGSIRDTTVAALAAEQGREMVVISPGTTRSLGDCFKMFGLIHHLVHKPQTVTRITHEVLHDFCDDNVKYVELRTTPRASDTMTRKSYVETVLNAFDTFPRRSEIIPRLILSVNRAEPLQLAVETVQLACEFKSRGVVGLDFSGNPKVGSFETFLPVFEEARRQGLKTTLHFAELPNEADSNAILNFRPDRLGHACFTTPAMVDTLARQHLAVEICATSNVVCNNCNDYSAHQFHDFHRLGIPLCVSTDDSGVFATTLSREYALLAHAANFSLSAVALLATQALEHIFDTSPATATWLGGHFAPDLALHEKIANELNS